MQQSWVLELTRTSNTTSMNITTKVNGYLGILVNQDISEKPKTLSNQLMVLRPEY